MIPGAILKPVEDASSAGAGSSDEGGKYFAMSLVASMPASSVRDGSVIVLPVTAPSDGERTDFTYLASSKLMFIRIHIRPQPLFTYGQCMAYSDGTAERLVPVGAALKFSSAVNYLVATPDLVGLMRNSIGPEVRIPATDNASVKRVYVRPLEVGGGEQEEEFEGKPKGTSAYVMGLEGVKRPTINKLDIPQREKDLHFSLHY
jgi:hypothetical protein